MFIYNNNNILKNKIHFEFEFEIEIEFEIEFEIEIEIKINIIDKYTARFPKKNQILRNNE